jgi:hypothetical protein
MYAAAHSLMAQSHIEDLHRAAAMNARRAEARRAAAAARASRRASAELVVRPSMFRRLATRFAV